MMMVFKKVSMLSLPFFRAFHCDEPPVLAFKVKKIDKKRGQVSLRHTKLIADRCFLPDLAGLGNALLHRT